MILVSEGGKEGGREEGREGGGGANGELLANYTMVAMGVREKGGRVVSFLHTRDLNYGGDGGKMLL